MSRVLGNTVSDNWPNERVWNFSTENQVACTIMWVSGALNGPSVMFYETRTDVMKSTLPLLLLAFTSGALGAQVTPGKAVEPATPGGATVSGVVVAEGTGFPIAFSTVRIQPLGRERFAD